MPHADARVAAVAHAPGGPAAAQAFSLGRRQSAFNNEDTPPFAGTEPTKNSARTRRPTSRVFSVPCFIFVTYRLVRYNISSCLNEHF